MGAQPIGRGSEKRRHVGLEALYRLEEQQMSRALVPMSIVDIVHDRGQRRHDATVAFNPERLNAALRDILAFTAQDTYQVMAIGRNPVRILPVHLFTEVDIPFEIGVGLKASDLHRNSSGQGPDPSSHAWGFQSPRCDDTDREIADDLIRAYRSTHE